MRYLSIDLGGKRTGLAVGDGVTGIVTPLGAIVTGAEHERMRGVERAVDEQGPGAVVVGLPLNMDGSEGGAAAAARAFAAAVAERTGLPVHLMDERLTTAAADQQLAGSGLTHGRKKRMRDSLAAAAILRDYLRAASLQRPDAKTPSRQEEQSGE